jgi:exopolyphosphatase/guanosine-5'-triphosphate,3'-diphosphate pyrophosphatase
MITSKPVYGAIDIGTNAARLLIGQVVRYDDLIKINKLTLTRVPLRLGDDVYQKGFITPGKIEMMKEGMKAFHHLMNAYNVRDYEAFATSAMREAPTLHDY